MRKRMERSKRTIGILLIVVSILAIFNWEKWGRNHFIYDDILVLDRNITRGDVITEDMLKLVKSDNAIKNCLKEEDKEKILGKEADQYIHKDAPLFEEYFTFENLAVSDDLGTEAIKIPESWIETIPSSLKKGENANFYSKGEFLMTVPVLSVAEDGKSFEVVLEGDEAKKLANIGSDGGRFVVTCN